MDKQDIKQDILFKIPSSDSHQDKELRAKYWSQIDFHNKGHMNMNQFVKGLRETIEIPIIFQIEPVLRRGWLVSKEKVNPDSKQGRDDISKEEFQYILNYLRQYYEYWLAFDRKDAKDNRPVNLEAFKKLTPALEKNGVDVDDVEKSFTEADRHGSGMIPFDDFCDWAVRKSLKLGKNK